MRPLAAVMGQWLLEALPRNERFDAIVPLPLHWWKRMQRGFNQSELLSRELSLRTGIPMLPLVRRRRATPAQAGLTSAQRRQNMRGAFEVRNPSQVDGRTLLLIDDVMTTGSTVNACAKALKSAGAARVCVLTVARAARRADPRTIAAAEFPRISEGAIA